LFLDVRSMHLQFVHVRVVVEDVQDSIHLVLPLHVHLRFLNAHEQAVQAANSNGSLLLADCLSAPRSKIRQNLGAVSGRELDQILVWL
ncbi:hypothetical protein PMAYCL1PPCAC_16681, partial [Pristionchus mayeri]